MVITFLLIHGSSNSKLSDYRSRSDSFIKKINKVKQIRFYSTNNQDMSKELNSWWVTGFADAEGSFTKSIFKSKTAAIGWTIEPCFIITLHLRDLELLNSIRNFFSVGSVSIVGKDARFRVR